MRSPRWPGSTNSGDLNGDGFVEYRRRSKLGLLNQGWKDSGDAIRHTDGRPAVGPIALAEVQGYVYAAKRAMARLARHRGEMELAARLDTAADVLRDRFDDAFWMPKARFYAMALDGEKRQVGSIGSNVGQALWSGIVPAERAARVAERILEPDMFSGWGVRTFASGQPGYNPVGYHTGSIWPHDNALIAAGLKASGATDGANLLAGRLIEAAQWFPDLRLPELFCGFTRDEVGAPVAYPVACSPQAWAAAAPFYLLAHDARAARRRDGQPARADPAEPARVARQDHHHGPAGRQAFGRPAGPSLARPDERRAHRPERRDRRHHPRLRRVTTMTEPTSTRGTIVVSGTGRVAVDPDIAELRLGVAVSRPSVEAARAAAAEAMTAILAAVTAAGVAKRDVRTTLLSVQPRYDYRDGKAPTLVGYDLANIVEVTARDLASLGAIVDGALSAGATSLDGLSFHVDDPREAERAARTAAVAEARSRAEVLAEAAGVAIAGVADIVEGGPPPTWPAAEGRPDAGGRRRHTGRGRHDRDLGHGDGDFPDRLSPAVTLGRRSSVRPRGDPQQFAAAQAGRVDRAVLGLADRAQGAPHLGHQGRLAELVAGRVHQPQVVRARVAEQVAAVEATLARVPHDDPADDRAAEVVVVLGDGEGQPCLVATGARG